MSGIDQARRLLQDAVEQLPQWRRLLAADADAGAGVGALGARRLADRHVLERMAGRLACGELLLFEHRRVVGAGRLAAGDVSPVSRQGLGRASAGLPQVPQARPPSSPTAGPDRSAGQRPTPAEKPVLHWIEIELIGDDDRPVPHQAYRLTWPDGTRIEGRLDAQGFGRHPGLTQSGPCQVTFPGLDREAWHHEQAAAARISA